jgi:4-amino-4-deoxy-L-arabinose transferase-like glycosyltransferase
MNTITRLLLIAILVAYGVLGVLYAINTPIWQVPDEPAHYNYIHALVEDRSLPVIEPQDYDQEYLVELVSRQFPPEMPVDSITYEDHQPPLYYLLAIPVYLSAGGEVLALRLFSVAIGAGLLVAAFRSVRILFPDRHSVALIAAALIAFLPQRLAMMAGVNNDGLAELMVGVVLWMSLNYVRGLASGRRFLIALGVVVGLALLTKTTAYVVIPVVVLAIWLRERREEQARPLITAATKAGLVLLVAGLLVAPWLIRNVMVYGLTDPLGLASHNAAVVGQPRTADWLAEYGMTGLLQRAVQTTFQSFWGQFGWMGVPLQPAVYVLLLLVAGLQMLGFVGWLVDRQGPRLEPDQRDGMWLIAVSAFVTLILFIGYNFTFVQHQGRYLFPALIPLALWATLGLDWLLGPRMAHWSAAGCGALGAVLAVWGTMRDDIPLAAVAAALGLAAVSGLAAVIPRWGRALATVMLIAVLVTLDIYALFWAIVPTLAG